MDLSVNLVPGMKYWNITVKQTPRGAIPAKIDNVKGEVSVQHKIHY
jgi:hypothetical protein